MVPSLAPGIDPLVVVIDYDHRLQNASSAVRQGLWLFKQLVRPGDIEGAIVLRDAAPSDDQYSGTGQSLSYLPTGTESASPLDVTWVEAIEIELGVDWALKSATYTQTWGAAPYAEYEIHTNHGLKTISSNTWYYELKLERETLKRLVGPVDYAGESGSEST